MKKIVSTIARNKWNISCVTKDDAERAVLVKINSNRMNLIDEGFLKDFHEAMDTIEKDYPKLPMVLTSENEGFFCKGMDTQIIKHLGEEDHGETVCNNMNDLFERLFLLERPAIAAINGKAIGGGFVLSLCCDFRFISPQYDLQMIAPHLGIPYPSSVYHILKYEVPWFKKFLLTGDKISGNTAIRERISLKHKYDPLEDAMNFIMDDIKCATTFTANKMALKKQNYEVFKKNEAWKMDELFINSTKTEETKELISKFISDCGCSCDPSLCRAI